jgi:predicted nucleotidyltransferase
MIPAISNHNNEIKALCSRFNVRRLDLFGSAARENDFTACSDIDVLVEFETKNTSPKLADFLDLRDSLSSLFGRKVDLTMASAIRNPYLRAAIDRSRVPLHGA